MGLYDNIKALCEKRGISVNKLERELNFPRGSVMKYNVNVPSVEKVSAIANFLDVSVDDIINLDVPADGQRVWYFDDETAQIAQWIADNPEMKAVMYALRDMPPDSARALAETIKIIKGTNIDG